MSEDAAVLLADFVSSLDNLPSEVCHILEEIGHKESRVSDLRSRALQRDQAIQKHAKSAAAGGQGLLVPNPKEESSIKKIKLDLENAEVTTREKLALSERGVNLLSRHLNRLQAQLELLTSSVPPLPTLPSFAPNLNTPTPNAMYGAQAAYTATPGGVGAYNPYLASYGGQPGTPGIPRKATPGQIPLLPAQMTPGAPSGYPFTAQTPGTPGTPLGSSSAANRRAGPSRLQNVAYASPAPGTPHGLPPHAQQQQQQQQQPNLAFLQQQQQMQANQLRIAQAQAQALAQQQFSTQAQFAQLQAQAQAQQAQQHAGGANKRKRGEEDRRGHEEVEGEAEGEDMTPYCFCHRPSFGEMIGCDAPDCKIEWFHLNCIGLKESPEGSWYCSQCEPRMKAQQQGRSGRKR
ncbi:Chromatin modification-related protein [Rhodotorula toruloides]|uniref:Chromatin modification-related protein n=1 Tax=Rhodotorula toruloides TaxID=5286 RepID=A0A0K3CE92_RHOTO|nr:Chromatin modification-related protein [Rhodotorula toruloides]PRQ77108.1 hypothetical protein AAT19DRAFT_12526 [Rhodotorula toruloides]